MTYLEDAATELGRARMDNEKRAELAAELATGKLPHMDILREVNDRRIEIADGFIRIAAIEAGSGEGLEHLAVEIGAHEATVTLSWEDPEDARQFLALHGELRRHDWLPDPSAERLRELTASATVREDGGDEH